ncbi:MAG: YicC/YloC family endoribonuclease [Christensenellales bacterium]|jgi:uncharacterized protein (TIGR00255 family)
MRSMTGYGRGDAQLDGRRMTVELKAVNHRYLDIALRMPRALSFLEEDARRLLKQGLSRGHVDVFASYQNLSDSAREVLVDTALAKAYAGALDTVGQCVGMPAAPSALDIARMPDVLKVTEAEEDQDALRGLFTQCMEEALRELTAMREVEGARLGADIGQKCDTIQAMGAQVAERAPEAVKAHQEKMRQRIQELLGDVQVDEARLINEAAFMADKLAIDEELVRLASHLKQTRAIMAGPQPSGRKLDFIVQEINREINTIGSKASDTAMQTLVVEMKSELEKVREQVQNIE